MNARNAPNLRLMGIASTGRKTGNGAGEKKGLLEGSQQRPNETELEAEVC